MLNKFLLSFALTSTFVLAQSGNPAVTTGQYDTNRTSANPNETILNPSNVNVNQFGHLFSWNVDGQIFAQPLYVPGVNVNGKTTNVVYVATMHNSVYAFDANNSNPNAPLWQVNFGPSVPSGSGTQSCPSVKYEGPELGILSTPVIDLSTQTLYAVSASPVSGGYLHTIHALDLTSGQEKFGGPKQIQASVATSSSHPAYNAHNGVVSLGPASTEVQRTALLLANGTVYAGFGNCGPDPDPWHGWVIGYNAANLQNQNVLLNITPNGGQGGIWQSARGLVADGSGNLYFTTGNATPTSQTGYNNASITTGSSDTDASMGNYPQRFLKTNSAGQILASFPPANYSSQNNNDLDFSSSGPVLIPGTNYIAAGGKDGIMYLFDISNLGAPLQSFQATTGGSCQYSGNGCNQIRGVAFWNNFLYVWGTNDVLQSFAFANGRFNTTATSQNSIVVSFPSAAFAVSANGTQSGIVWGTTPDNTLHAFNAANVATELWNSNQNAGRDALPSFVRFAQPTVANGRVYVATSTSKQLAVYGLLSDFTVSASPNSQTVYQGNSTSFTVNVNALTGFNGTVNLSVSSGLPANATASFSPASVNGTGSSVVTISTAGSTPTGTYNLIINGTQGGEARTAGVTLVVTTPDSTPPTVTCCGYTYNPDGSYNLIFTGQDTGSGMKSIVPVQLVNATASIPPFTQGTTAPINFTATESGWSSYVEFQLTDVAGNTTNIDPAILDDTRQPGAPVPYAVKDLGLSEYMLTIINGPNGKPGLKNVRIDVVDGPNPKHIQVAGLKDGETRTLNLQSYFPTTGTAVTVNITPLGKPGGVATFIFGSPNIHISVQ